MKLRIRRLVALAAIALLAAAISGCAESSRPQASGKGAIRGINAIATSPELGFRIEERLLSGVNFRQAAPFSSWDNLTYNINFDLSLPGLANDMRLATQFLDVEADHEYTVVLGGSIANPTIMYWDDPQREWTGSETVFEVFFAHLAPSLGAFDVYFAGPGTPPAPGQAIGSLANGERLPVIEFEEGTYELILTPRNDPATIAYQSIELSAAARIRIMFAIFDPDPARTSDVAVSLLRDDGSSSALPDPRFPQQARMLHAAFGTQNFDGYVNGDFATAVYPDVGFKELTPYADIDTTPVTFTATQAGNPGATILEDDVNVPAGTLNTIALVGEPGSPVFVRMADDARPLETYPLIRVLNSSENTTALDIYMVEPGTSLEDVLIPQVVGLPSLAHTTYRNAPDGMVELTATLFANKTPVSAPLLLDLANGDRVDLVVFDTADPNVVELVAYPY